MKVEGIPDGWELVRIGKPLVGEYYIDVTGSVYKALDTTPTVLHWHVPIIRKIEKPKRYRPFAKPVEAQPLIGEVLRLKVDHQDKFVVIGITSHAVLIGIQYWSLQEAFDCFERLDGTPFGIEVTE